MENKVVEVIDALCDKFGIAVDWTSENIFPYLQDLMERFVKYTILKNSLSIFFVVLITLLSFNFYKKRRGSNTDSEIFGGIVFFLCFSGFLFIVPTCSFEIITAITIPEKIIIETIQSMGV